MTDELNTSSTSALAEMPVPEDLQQTVEITDVGPCKKHVKVTVGRAAIDKRFDEKYSELMKESKAQLNGFRPGKAPKQVVVRRFKSVVQEEVQREVLMASLEKLAGENQLSPLSPPEIDPDKLEIPEQGDFIYEFNVEVRPEFELPAYKGMKLKRPVKTFTDEDIEKEQKKLLEPYGQLVPKEGENPVVELNDYIICDATMHAGETEVNNLKEIRIKIEKRLVLPDGVAENFGQEMCGAKAGETRKVEIALSNMAANPVLRGRTITATFLIKDIKTIRQPELTQALLNQFEVSNPEQLKELISVYLERRLEYVQRQVARQEILAQVSEASQWELPQDLLIRQAKKTLSRRIMEMKNAGMSDDEIVAEQQMIAQDSLRSTAMSLREHFVLQKIAELEKLEIEDRDIDAEIDRIADREGESPRKVRARLEREDMIEALATELLERKALQVVLDHAEFIDVPLPEEDMESQTTAVKTQVVPGQMPETTDLATGEPSQS